jgi:uroporphyrinogen decarboxylase
MADMSKRERIKAALAGKTVDRVPVAFWRHWPGDDQHAESLATAALEFQRQYDLDFIKVPVSSTYCVDDYGVKHAYRGGSMGDRDYLERVIKRAEDWDRIEPLDVRKGTYGIHLEALRLILEKKEPDTPVLFTMFNPLAMALYLAGDETCLVHIRREPERVERAIKALAETCARFAGAVIAEGCDGIFLSTRAASYEVLNEDEYNRFGRPGDLTVLAAAAKGWFNVLHLHGQHPMFLALSDYPVRAVNWHDRTAQPDLTEAGRLFPGALMGGIEQYRILHLGTPENIVEQAQSAIEQTNGRRLILTPGCTYPLGVPHGNLLALRQAVEKPRRSIS